MIDEPYAIITPAHNEAAFLPAVIESIQHQSILPSRWIIVDDRSKDETGPLIEAASKNHPFIEPVRITGSKERSVGANVVRVFETGSQFLPEDVAFIVKMDADIVLPPDYFERILAHFNKDEKLGMASGKTYIRQKGRWVLERAPDTHVYGSCKTYRKTCLKDIGGHLPLLGWDILDGAKARMKNWNTKSFRNLAIYHLRQMSTAKGIFRGRIRSGRAMYTIRAHPLFVAGKSVFRALEKPYATGLLIFMGYLACFLTRPERLNDPELAQFLRKEQLSRLLGKTRRQEELLPRKLSSD